MSYSAPVHDLMVALKVAGGLDSDIYPELQAEDAKAILDEAGRFASERIAPINRAGDTQGARMVNGRVVTADGWAETYRDWCAAGWSGLTGHTAFGGQGLPMIMAAACAEMWNAASIAFAVNFLLTTGAIEAITAHASPELKEYYLPKMVAGVWTGTMNLTEPQSGSDLSGLRCKAERHADGSYRITGTKIFITCGDHDWADNIIHLVLARLSDAPPGTRGISLFLVPKVLPDGALNDVRCHALEHKLGLHGSPTCTMIYGDKGGATGWLIGEENRGLNCMFTMMNSARLLVGVQGVGLAERATQAAIAYARQRQQGKAPGAHERQSHIIAHPDVKRMLLEMQGKTMAARLLCMATAAAIDQSVRSTGEGARMAAQARASLLTPLAKSFATDIAVEVTSLGLQVHGGMGYVEETGVAQYYRDARILPIYEGTNGIQAIDLITRKLQLENGQTLHRELERCSHSMARWEKTFGQKLELHQTVLAVEKAAHAIVSFDPASALAVAHPFQRALAATLASGHLIDMALEGKSDPDKNFQQSSCLHFLSTEIPKAKACCDTLEMQADAVSSFH